MKAIWIGILATAFTLGACGGKKEDGKKDKGGTADKGAADKGDKTDKGDKSKAAPADNAAAAAEVTKLLPPELAGKLEFTTAKGEDDRFVAVVPKGWEESKYVPGSYKPTDSSLGFMSKFSVGTNCDGSCDP